MRLGEGREGEGEEGGEIQGAEARRAASTFECPLLSSLRSDPAQSTRVRRPRLAARAFLPGRVGGGVKPWTRSCSTAWERDDPLLMSVAAVARRLLPMRRSSSRCAADVI